MPSTVDGMFSSDTLAVSSAARSIAAELFCGAGTRLRAPFWYRALTASLLPPRLRDAFELPYGPSELRSVERVLTVFRNRPSLGTGRLALCRALP